jgi:hypothetical protein
MRDGVDCVTDLACLRPRAFSLALGCGGGGILELSRMSCGLVQQ